MSIEITWFDSQQTILLIRVIGDWAWGDFVNTDYEIKIMGESINHPFDAITDLTASGSVPTGDIMSNVAKSVNINPANFRLSVWVKTPKRLQAAIEVLNATTVGYPKRIFVDTLPEALKIIDSHRKTDSN